MCPINGVNFREDGVEVCIQHKFSMELLLTVSFGDGSFELEVFNGSKGYVLEDRC